MVHRAVGTSGMALASNTDAANHPVQLVAVDWAAGRRPSQALDRWPHHRNSPVLMRAARARRPFGREALAARSRLITGKVDGCGVGHGRGGLCRHVFLGPTPHCCTGGHVGHGPSGQRYIGPPMHSLKLRGRHTARGLSAPRTWPPAPPCGWERKLDREGTRCLAFWHRDLGPRGIHPLRRAG